MFNEKIEGSIDIGSSSVKGLRLKNRNIEKLDLETIPHGAILSGNIEDHMAVSDSIKALVDRLELKNKRVVVSLPVQNFFVKFISIVQVDESEKLPLIENELEDLIPNFSGEDFITHYIDLGDADGKNEVIALTISKSKVSEIIEILTNIKVIPVKIVPDFISIYNLLYTSKDAILEDNVDASFMVVDIGAEATKIFVEKNGIIKMQRIAAIGGNDFTDVVEKNLHMEYSEAERYKKKLEVQEDVEEDVEDEEVIHEIGDLVDELTGQIRRSIDYYRTQEGLLGVDTIIVTGGASQLNGYISVLEKKIMMEIKHFPIMHFLMQNKEQQDFIKNNIKRFDVVIGNIIDEVIM